MRAENLGPQALLDLVRVTSLRTRLDFRAVPEVWQVTFFEAEQGTRVQLGKRTVYKQTNYAFGCYVNFEFEQTHSPQELRILFELLPERKMLLEHTGNTWLPEKIRLDVAHLSSSNRLTLFAYEHTGVSEYVANVLRSEQMR